ncbi:MAG: glycosyltransferase [Parcubacteria group bacterium]|nr:glycosyltransferase [Parcubacteria group bacterium]
MRKKLLFIITKSEMGGAQRFLYELVTHLNQEKYDISVAAGYSPTGKGELFGKLNVKNIKTVKIRNFSNMPGIKNFLAFFEILGIIIKTKPDVIYLLSSEAGFSGAIAGSFYRFFSRSPSWSFGEADRKLKIIYRIGGWAFKEPRNIIIKKIYLWAEKISAPFKDIIVVNSEFDRQLAIKNKITRPEKIITIYNGIDLNEIKFLSKEEVKKFIGSKIENLKLKIENFILIGTIANLYKNKGLDFLILAAARIKKSQPSWQFIIIGNGPEKLNLEKLIKNHGLENDVFLIGSIPDAHKYLKAFDLFVLPSVKEGQPWVILEAMAAEIPIVATNIAGIPEMIENEKSGLLVEPTDPDALAAAIEKTLTHPSLAHKMAQNALTAIREKFRIEEMVKKNEELF